MAGEPSAEQPRTPSRVPVRLCEECGTYNHASAKSCEECGVEFPQKVGFGFVAAGEALIIGDGPVMEIVKVHHVSCHPHTSMKSGKATLKVTYYSGLRQFSEWVCLEHEGWAGKKGRDWWTSRWTDDDYIPESVEEAMDFVGRLVWPTHIRVWIKPKHSEVMACDFSGTGFGTCGVQEDHSAPSLKLPERGDAAAAAVSYAAAAAVVQPAVNLPSFDEDDIPF